MNIKFVNRFFGPLDAAGGIAAAAGSASPVGLALGVAQAGFGIVQSISANSKIKKALARRTAYTTPSEYFDILQATQSMASQGYDPFTLNYLTNQTDRAFDSSLSAATRLGADPNVLSNLFDQKLQATMKIGAENHALNMENFSKYLNAKDVIGTNAAAEWKSKQDMIKDELQSLGAEKQAGLQNLGSGLNATISTAASNDTAKLYTEMLAALKAVKTGGIGSAVGKAA